MNQKRVRSLKEVDETRRGPVVYWMSRDQRVHNNWALLYAQQLAREQNVPLAVLFSLVPSFLQASGRHYQFMIKGLQQVETTLAEFNIPFVLLVGPPPDRVPPFISNHSVGMLVTDFSPLRIGRFWRKTVAEQIDIPFYEIDAHNIVPCWEASPKQEYAARTIRPKIQRALPEFLEEFPPLKEHTTEWEVTLPKPDWGTSLETVEAEEAGPEIEWLTPGQRTAQAVLQDFLENKLSSYPDRRNDPTQNNLSNLSPYLHFGQISAQFVALQVKKSEATEETKEAFLEELIVRRELSDNFCFYNDNYDNPKGFPDWAKETLREHEDDKREYLYTRVEFEQAETHDDLWNAAQLEMVHFGKMHGYMRMYWAKKILEWSESPAAAMKVAIYLNDKYELDGRDPNGYVGVAWSIGGVHDRGWPERDVFGKVRYMNYNGAKRKFDVDAYIKEIFDKVER